MATMAKKRELLKLDMTPLIDVVLLLLIFFMLSTNFVNERLLEISLPKISDTLEAAQNVDDIIIAVDAQGQYSVNELMLEDNSAAVLQQVIVNVSDNDTSLPLTIAGDAEAPHQAIVTVLEVAGRLGFAHVNIAAAHQQ